MENETKKKPLPEVEAQVIKALAPVQKAESPTQLSAEQAKNIGDWISPPVDMRGYEALADNSTIIPQCIASYKNNIPGFGIKLEYKEEFEEETPEMKQEWARAQEIVDLLTMDMDAKELFEATVETRETFGIAYQEVIRNLEGKPIGLELIFDTPSIRKTVPLEPYVDVNFWYNGKQVTRKKKFCKYKQEIAGKTVYFKEIGDPRVMNKATGEYVGEGLPLQQQANEILEYKIGNAPYGKVRWLGQVLGVDGSKKAEGLNHRYFEEGRHVPLMILVKNGKLSDKSVGELQQYMNGVKGEAGQHAFLLLQAVSTANSTATDDVAPPEVELKEMASILQKDELFQDYMDNVRRRVQSSFRLPDLYVAYTTDFNRATAQTAMEITEKQVFQPERISLAWVINNKLLADYQFKYVQIAFAAPSITNPDDLFKILNVTERAGGLTPNKAKDLTYSFMGDTAEPYDGEWGDMPIALLQLQQPSGMDQEPVTLSKSANTDGTDKILLAVIKDVRNVLEELQEGKDNG